MSVGPRPPAAANATRTTLREVARLTNTSIATVSKVINARAGVSAATRQRVEAGLEVLGYVSLGARRQAAEQQGEPIIEVLLDADGLIDPYCSALVGKLLTHASSSGIGLVVRSTNTVSSRPPAGWGAALARAGRAGVIEVAGLFSQDRHQQLNRAGLPLVLLDPFRRSSIPTHTVAGGDYAGSYAATKHLLSLGHRSIAFIGSSAESERELQRARGWVTAMQEVHASTHLTAEPRETHSHAYGLRTGRQFLRRPHRPTAVLTSSDATAAGVLHAAAECRLDVPGDLSVVGFDDTLHSSGKFSTLTTVRQPFAGMATAALNTVIELARGQQIPEQTIEMVAHLVIRESTAPSLLNPHETVSTEEESA